MEQTRPQWNIRRAALNDIPALKSLYLATITTVCAADYTPEQIRAWSATAERTESLARRIESQYFIVAISSNDEIIGFASFEEPDYLDMMYVHKDFQHRGVGGSLLKAIREKAFKFCATKIVSDVSVTARPFFEKHGFHLVQEQTVRIGDIELTNFKMEGPAAPSY